MAYTVWKDGKQIGRTDLEITIDSRRRAGTFVPSQYGLTVLPGISAMLPALMAFGQMCRRNGLKVDEYSLNGKRFPFNEWVGTPEGHAVAEAAKHLADVELRDARGQTVFWEVLLISDVDEVRSLAGKRATPNAGDTPANPGAIYFMSVTLAPQLRAAFDRVSPRDAPLAIC